MGLLAALGGSEVVLMSFGFAPIAMGQLSRASLALGLVKQALGQFKGGHGTPRLAGTALNSRSRIHPRQEVPNDNCGLSVDASVPIAS